VGSLQEGVVGDGRMLRTLNENLDVAASLTGWEKSSACVSVRIRGVCLAIRKV